jgi:hypothetical protein
MDALVDFHVEDQVQSSWKLQVDTFKVPIMLPPVTRHDAVLSPRAACSTVTTVGSVINKDIAGFESCIVPATASWRYDGHAGTASRCKRCRCPQQTAVPVRIATARMMGSRDDVNVAGFPRGLQAAARRISSKHTSRNGEANVISATAQCTADGYGPSRGKEGALWPPTRPELRHEAGGHQWCE